MILTDHAPPTIGPIIASAEPWPDEQGIAGLTDAELERLRTRLEEILLGQEWGVKP